MLVGTIGLNGVEILNEESALPCERNASGFLGVLSKRQKPGHFQLPAVLSIKKAVKP